MQDVVSACSRITFGASVVEYVIPDELIIEPPLILDEHNEVYRISIGKTDIPEDEEAAYRLLFSELDKRMPFVSDMHIDVDGNKLTLELALVMRTQTDNGIFYDIEAALKDIKYEERIIDGAK